MNSSQLPVHRTRRDFLTMLAAAGASLLAAPIPAGSALNGSNRAEATTSFAALKAAVGTGFLMQSEEGPVKLRLDDIDDGVSKGGVHSYSARFSVVSCPSSALSQHTYTLSSRHLGSMDLFLIPDDPGKTTSMRATFCTVVAV